MLQGLTKQLKHCGAECQRCRVWAALIGNSFLTSSQCSLLQFERVLLSSVQDGIHALGKTHVHSVPSLRSFPNVAFETVPMFAWLTNNGPLLSFQGKSSSTSSFRAFLFQAINGVMSLALCSQVVSQAPQHFKYSKKLATCEGCFACQCIRPAFLTQTNFCSHRKFRSFPFTPATPGQYTHRSFQRWMLTTDTFQRRSTETHPPFFLFLPEQWENVHTYCKHSTWIMEQKNLVFAPFPKTVGSKHSTLSVTNTGLKIFKNI